MSSRGQAMASERAPKEGKMKDPPLPVKEKSKQPTPGCPLNSPKETTYVMKLMFVRFFPRDMALRPQPTSPVDTDGRLRGPAGGRVPPRGLDHHVRRQILLSL